VPDIHPHPTLVALAARYSGPRDDRWAPVPAELDAAIAGDPELGEAACRARVRLVAELSRRFGFGERLLEAVLLTPRERFVLPEDIASSADDTPLPLDRAGRATVSAPHAYLLTYDLLELGEGDHLLELGTGTGYGAALARRIVGPRGHVTSIEIDAVLHERAKRLLGGAENEHLAAVTLLHGDGRKLAEQVLVEADRSARQKIAITYALRASPAELERLLPEGGRLVAPVGVAEEAQELVRVDRRGGEIRREAHGAVRYVTERMPGL
jgi:protein-L-isoaspartate(D-aspartate) O-methyltransferase